jgi:hypothetical protein
MRGEKQLRQTLSPTQDIIFGLVRLGKDVKIERMFARIYPNKHDARGTAMQKALGPHISRLNFKLCEFGWIVRPGTARRTYRIYTLEAAPKQVHGRKAARR